jgi:hypothetical protein
MANLLGWLVRGADGCVSGVNVEGVREWEREEVEAGK